MHQAIHGAPIFFDNPFFIIFWLVFFSRKPSGPSKAMKLGRGPKDVDAFVDQLKSEGESKCWEIFIFLPESDISAF